MKVIPCPHTIVPGWWTIEVRDDGGALLACIYCHDNSIRVVSKHIVEVDDRPSPPRTVTLKLEKP